jgi:ABC-2 type transport system permease protein
LIGAILRAQFLSMRPRARRSKAGPIFSALTSLLFYSFWIFFAWLVFLFFSLPDSIGYFQAALSSGLFFATLYWQFSPVISAGFGASLELRKLLAYPIPRRDLFLIEILLRVTTCPEMLILLVAVVAGLLRNPFFGWRAAPLVLAGGLLFAVMNIVLSAGIRHLLEHLFLRTRLKEAMMLVFIAVGLAPQLFSVFHVRLNGIQRFAPDQIGFPWSAAAHLILRERIIPALALSLAWLAAILWFSSRQFAISLRAEESGAKRRAAEMRTETLGARLLALPGRLLPDPTGAIVEKELRTLTRISRFRIVYFMSCFFGLVLYLPALARGARDTVFTINALPIMALYGLLMLGQISYWNSFGFDRSAAQGYFSWPLRLRDVLIAKNLAVIALLIPQIAILALICRAVKLPAGPGKILEALVVIVIAAAYWLALGNISSVRIPRALDPARMNQMSNKMQALTIWAAPFLLLPLVLAYWARWYFESQLLFVALLGIAALIGGIFYWVGLDSAVETALRRREAMLTELSRTEGPLSLT